MQTLRRLAVLGALALVAGCSSMGYLSEEDRLRLSQYLENAAHYYDRGHYDRAYQQWGKALEVDPENVKGRLGQGMALYQLGKETSPDGLARLTEAETRLDDLRRKSLEGQQWKAELGYALVQERWVELYDQKLLLLEQGGGDDGKEKAHLEKELGRRITSAEASFRYVLEGDEEELHDRLTCQLALARLASRRGDLDTSLGYCRDYGEVVDRSKGLWRDNIQRFPTDAAIYEKLLTAAERQEAELRDLMANVLFKLGELDEAEEELDKVLALQPERELAFLNRGIVHQAQKDWDRAAGDFSAFLRMTTLGEDDPHVVEASRRLIEVQELVQEEDELRRNLENGSN